MILRSLFVTLRLYNPKRQSSAIWAAINHAKNHDYNVVNTYGYPVVNKAGHLYGMQLLTFKDATIETSEDHLVTKLDNGQVWLCVRVLRVEKLDFGKFDEN